ncbi:hypothetical protein [Niveispirillum sp. KHB5.9]|uniref:hypothetical protein n=1 Tax=Niveispirillum sp. KHB5.9 TaxID=3400269 RepID=UPI003A84348B
MPDVQGRWRSLFAGLALLCVIASPVLADGAPGDLLSGHLNIPTAEAAADSTKAVAYLTTALEIGEDPGRLVIDFADGTAGATLSLGDPRSRGHRFLVDPNIMDMAGLPAGTYQACWMEMRKGEQRAPLKSLGCWQKEPTRKPNLAFTVNAGDILYLGHLRGRADGLVKTVLIAETLLKRGVASDPAFNQTVDDKLAVHGLTKSDIHGYGVRTLSDGSNLVQVWLDEQKIPAGTLLDLLVVPRATSLMGVNSQTLMRFVFSVEDRLDEFSTSLPPELRSRVRTALLLQPGEVIIDAVPVGPAKSVP